MVKGVASDIFSPPVSPQYYNAGQNSGSGGGDNSASTLQMYGSHLTQGHMEMGGADHQYIVTRETEMRLLKLGITRNTTGS